MQMDKHTSGRSRWGSWDGGMEGVGGGRRNPVWLKISFSEILNLIDFLYRIYPNKYSLTLLLILLKFQQVHFTICEPV